MVNEGLTPRVTPLPYLVSETQERNMAYRFWNTSSKDSSRALARNSFFAFLIDCINSLFDIIFRVSLTLSQSLRLKTTDLGLPSGVVINSTFGNSSVFSNVKPPFALIKVRITKRGCFVNQKEKKGRKGLFRNIIFALFIISSMICVFPALASAATINYTYDDEGQITKAAYDAMTIEYAYDNSGNRTSKNACASARLMRSGSVYGNYSTLQAAYDAAVDGDTIQSRAVTFTENLTINKSITLDGGYDCNFTSHTGTTVLSGGIDIISGTANVTIDNFDIQ